MYSGKKWRFFTYKQDRSDCNYETLKSLRNKAQYAIHKAKEDYFTETCRKQKSDSKSLWTT